MQILRLREIDTILRVCVDETGANRGSVGLRNGLQICKLEQFNFSSEFWEWIDKQKYRHYLKNRPNLPQLLFQRVVTFNLHSILIKLTFKMKINGSRILFSVFHLLRWQRFMQLF